MKCSCCKFIPFFSLSIDYHLYISSCLLEHINWILPTVYCLHLQKTPLNLPPLLIFYDIVPHGISLVSPHHIFALRIFFPLHLFMYSVCNNSLCKTDYEAIVGEREDHRRKTSRRSHLDDHLLGGGNRGWNVSPVLVSSHPSCDPFPNLRIAASSSFPR